MKYIIGISAFYHDSSVALYQGGRLVLFLKEEWLTRIKGTRTFPYRSLQLLRTKFDLTDEMIQFVVFYEKPLKGWMKLLSHSLEKPFERWKQTASNLKSFWDGGTSFESCVKQVLSLDKLKILYCPHHLSHSLSSYAYVGFSGEWTSVVVDGVGDGVTSSIFKINGDDFKLVWESQFPDSLGLFYAAITDFLGFNINDGEYKVMGLAGYGDPIHAEFFRDEVIKFLDGKLVTDLSWFEYHKDPERSYSQKLIQKMGPPYAAGNYDKYRVTKSREFKRLADIASSAQKCTEDILKDLVKFAIHETGVPNILMSGGVAQNCVAMMELASSPFVKKFSVPPSPGDSGAAIGAAIFGSYVASEKLILKPSLYPGPTNSEHSTEQLFSTLFKKVENYQNVTTKIIELIQSGEVIASCILGAETGPRALGNRSIICDAHQPKVVAFLNKRLKKREEFRPLAPVMLHSTAEKYFHLNDKVNDAYEWMGVTAKVKKQFVNICKGFLHVDNTARVQIVNDRLHPLYKVLMDLDNLYGKKFLINTSFNISGDPIVFDYVDAFVNMKRMSIKWLWTEGGLYKVSDV